MLMFFIGIFGVNTKTEPVKTETAVICPLCERYGRYEVLKAYTYFHIFFIPIWRWNKRYYIKTHCCDVFSEIDRETGERIEAGEAVEIEKEQILDAYISIRICPNCHTKVEPNFQYCPHCGTRL